MIRRPPRSTPLYSSAASDVYKRQDLRYAFMPWRSMPNSGTAIITHSASAAVVESEPVGGSKPGITVPRLAVATNRKSVPKKPMYLRGWLRPTSFICCSIPVTTISSRFCQRERVRLVESLRVMSLEPTARNSIKPHVKTMVPLSFKNPCCQKIISSGLRRMANLLGQPCHDLARHDKTQQARQPALQIATRRNIKPGQRQPHAQQPTGQQPNGWLVGGQRLAHRPPQATEEKRAEHAPRGPGQHQGQHVIHRHSPVHRAWPDLPCSPNARHSNSPVSAQPPAGPASRSGLLDSADPAKDQAPRPAGLAPLPTSRSPPSSPDQTTRRVRYCAVP